MNKPPCLTDLPFILDAPDEGGKPRLFWHVKATEDYDADCRLGARYADLTIAYIAQTGFTPLLGWIVQDMTGDNGIVTGFSQRLAERLAERLVCQQR